MVAVSPALVTLLRNSVTPGSRVLVWFVSSKDTAILYYLYRYHGFRDVMALEIRLNDSFCPVAKYEYYVLGFYFGNKGQESS